ncbi:site-specific DNA-methyltransferase [Avibacterium paragallinarum]|uniref:site-specific DNA-methyltransferase n=1 Tax=Avibacterium paragallinarum TaxID=728 RepID=UPI00397B29E3
MPEIFSEQQIDFEKFKQLFANEIATHPDRYTLNWAGKSEAYQVLQTPTQQTLTPCEAESVDFAQSQNVFIEGENLEVLKILQKSYFNSVKMIYIDPPYNTGNDFIYKDNFADSQADYAEKVGDKDEAGKLKRAFVKNSKENGHYHSNWLNMMLPRLHLARNLLRDDGVIFISIDDNEQAQLKLLCDEVFGEENFVAELIWEKKFSPQNDAKWFSTNHDYIVCYAKSSDACKINLLPRTDEANSRYGNIDNDFRGNWTSDNLLRKDVQQSGLYTITTPNGTQYNPPSGRSWRVSQEKFNEMVADNRIWFGKSGGNVPRIKRFLSEVQNGIKAISLLKYNEVGHNQEASQELRKIFDGESYFDTPKPIRLLERILTLSTDKNDLILDFFAGSATTAHAVMQLNAEDGGNRRFICVQLPEKTEEKSEAFKAGFHTIAEISKERIRRAGKQIAEQYPDKTIDTGFKAFKLSGSHFKQWQTPTEQDLEKQLQMFIDPVAENTDTQAMMYELLLRLGFSLTAKVRWENHVYWVEENHQRVALILNEVNESIINDVMARQPQKVVMLDRLFNGDDAFKKNTELQMSDANIALWVI